MSRQEREQRRAELDLRFGKYALEGETRKEQRELWQGATMTAILAGSPVCQSLADTAKNGGC